MRKNIRSAWCMVLIVVEKKRPVARPLSDATTPVEYLIICSD